MTVLIVSMTACVKHNANDGNDDYKEVNDWILENMQLYYLWNTHIPQKSNKALNPADYFESLLYQTEDRFSWIQDNFIELLNSLSGVNTEAGYDFNLLRMSENSSEVLGYITYIKANTPAETAGLARGDYFIAINGTQLNLDNYSSLIAQTSKQHTLGIAVISENTIVSTKNVPLNVIENYAENPIFLDTIYSINDKKIGYFVYNFFARDNGDGSVSYEKEMNQLFYKFKSANINELIVDLRYNPGGISITTEALAGMISGRTKTDIFYYNEYNDIVSQALRSEYGQDYNKNYFVDNITKYNSDGTVTEQTPINKLTGLSKVYFIVSNRTASASELLINGLKPYMNVVLIGGTTYGKNVGSITIYEDDPVKQKNNKWGMQPIVVKISNVDGFSDYGNGFTPNMPVNEHSSVQLKPLGDTEELMLQTTLDVIFGTSRTRTKATNHIASFVGSSIDKTPARQNLNIFPKNREIK
jgi:C-terminal processing protease CtpA/Prc